MKFSNYYLRSPIVLISGPTGVGKSKTAKDLHYAIHNSNAGFAVAHLASLSDELMESELFGHEKGAFTGAISKKNGYLDRAQNGTIFFDEIGELSLNAQKKLLYLLEERMFTPVGATTARSFNGKIIAATNKDLRSMVEDGTFRKDLFYRLKLCEIHIKAFNSLDISHKRSIAQSINREMSKKWNYPELAFTEKFEDLLKEYSFDGNIRELKHIIEFHYLDCRHELNLVDCPLLSDKSEIENSNIDDLFSGPPMSFRDLTAFMESKYLRHALQFYCGKINETARKIGISKVTLIAKIRKYGINNFQIKADYRQTEIGLS